MFVGDRQASCCEAKPEKGLTNTKNFNAAPPTLPAAHCKIFGRASILAEYGPHRLVQGKHLQRGIPRRLGKRERQPDATQEPLSWRVQPTLLLTCNLATSCPAIRIHCFQNRSCLGPVLRQTRRCNEWWRPRDVLGSIVSQAA
jgi:hypothetical protein